VTFSANSPLNALFAGTEDNVGRSGRNRAIPTLTPLSAVTSESAEIGPCVRRSPEYVGTKRFHEGTRGWSFALGHVGELVVNRRSFDVYVCDRCGRVELFVDGIGEEFRPH
jgi:hypothetical protein